MFKPEVIDFVSKPWQWFAFQSGQRVLEVTMCVLIAIAMMKSPKDYSEKNVTVQSIVKPKSVSDKTTTTESGSQTNGVNDSQDFALNAPSGRQNDYHDDEIAT